MARQAAWARRKRRAGWGSGDRMETRSKSQTSRGSADSAVRDGFNLVPPGTPPSARCDHVQQGASSWSASGEWVYIPCFGRRDRRP